MVACKITLSGDCIRGGCVTLSETDHTNTGDDMNTQDFVAALQLHFSHTPLSIEIDYRPAVGSYEPYALLKTSYGEWHVSDDPSGYWIVWEWSERAEYDHCCQRLFNTSNEVLNYLAHRVESVHASRLNS